jgi:hypothetical protein
VTIVDDGTLDGRRGSLNIDDEGHPSQCTTLIEDGILVGYMQDSLNARLMGMAPTGNGRRESFAHLTMPRMTNTYMRAGQHDPQEMIRSVKKGLYAVNFGGGQVDITSGKYVFSATEAYLIEDGRITAPVKGDPDRQRSGNHAEGAHGRQRPGPGRGRGHLWQGRAERAGGCRPAVAVDRGHHRRRYPGLSRAMASATARPARTQSSSASSLSTGSASSALAFRPSAAGSIRARSTWKISR